MCTCGMFSDGRWLVSESDEFWPADAPSFATREEAEHYAGAQVGGDYVGRCELATPERVVEGLDIERMFEAFDEDETFERWGLNDGKPLINVDGALVAEIRAAIADVIRRRGALRSWYVVHDIERIDDIAPSDTPPVAGENDG